MSAVFKFAMHKKILVTSGLDVVCAAKELPIYGQKRCLNEAISKKRLHVDEVYKSVTS